MACATSINLKMQRNWGWLVTFASFVMNFFGFGIMYCFSITFVSLQDEFNSGSTATSWAGSIPIGLATTAGIFVTPLVARFENRPVAVAGVFMCCVSCVLTSFITDFRLIYISYSVLYGLGNGFSSLASMDLLLRYFPKKNCSRSTLISLIGSSSGMLALGPLTYIVIENWGWRNMFRFFGGLLLLVSLPAVITFSLPNAHQSACAEEKKDEKKKVAAISTSDSAPKRRPTLLEVDERLPEKEGVEHIGYVEEEQRHRDIVINPGYKGQLESYSSPDVPNGNLLENPYTYHDLKACDLVIRVESEKQPRLDTQAVEATSVISMLSPEKNDITSLRVITISSSNSCKVQNVDNHSSALTNGDAVKSPTAGQKQMEAEGGLGEEERQGFFQKYRALFYPDLWLVCICVTGLPMMNTFYYINMGDFLISRGFERHVIPWTVTTFGVSEVVGKILLAAIADRLPFPKLFIYHFACAVGIVVMGCLLVVTTVPVLLVLTVATGLITMMVADALAYSICNQVFRPIDVVQTWTVVMTTQGLGYMLGSLFGESIDRTGSYNAAIYTSMGIYALCGLVCTAVPIYQKYVTPKRFVMFEYQNICRRKKSIQKRHQPKELIKEPL